LVINEDNKIVKKELIINNLIRKNKIKFKDPTSNTRMLL